jgi:hypothetical protein
VNIAGHAVGHNKARQMSFQYKKATLVQRYQACVKSSEIVQGEKMYTPLRSTETDVMGNTLLQSCTQYVRGSESGRLGICLQNSVWPAAFSRHSE